MQKCEKFKNDIFLQVIENFNFLFFSEALQMTGNHHNMTSGHRQFNYSFIWLQNLHKCEKSKNDIFLQIENFIFYLFFQKPFLWQKFIIIWHQDT